MIPISNAAGTVKYVLQAQRLAQAPVSEIVLGSYTEEHRMGNPGNVYYSENGVALNSLGMPNPGMNYMETHAEEFLALGKPIVVSIAGFNVHEYEMLASSASWASAIEVNLGCPNVWKNLNQERIASFNPKYMLEILDAVAAKLTMDTDLRVKLSPYSDPLMLANVASVIDAHEVDAIVASNTFPNGWLPNALDAPYGGVSGATMKAIVLGQVRQFRAVCNVPVIAAGGLRNGVDMMDYEAAGASGVQVASRYLDYGEDPDVFVSILSQAASLGA